MAIGAVCYELDDKCYYIHTGQAKMLDRVNPEQRDRMIRKWSYATGKKGEPVVDPDGTGRTAVIMPEGEVAPAPADDPEEVPEVSV